ncbi:MAG: hypothetical protein IJ177_13320 [Fibrobacter sp.]|uniref:FISUMP domain-containing protein n=1 Tax=Fibrobacter sp. TaxID=35828 RepID=UPI0025BEDF6F|nr:FISUMP domain-containing protein [Fibrobacter sp.]MBQ9227135.1 hypothetical protein [Fibrobacter sp.]
MEELKEILNSSLRAIGTMALLLLAACSDIGDRDNPLDPGADNYVAIDDDPESSSSAIQSDDSRDKSSSSVSSSSNASSSSEKQSSSSSSSDVILSASEESSSSKMAPSSSSKDVEPDEKSSSSEQAESSSDEAPVTSSETPTQSSSSEVSPPPSSSSKDEPKSSSSSETVTPWTCGDSTITRGDHEYATVVINEQCWLKENLQYEPSSGTTLCYGGAAANCETYGRLYDFEAANLACPTGWRLPTKTELEDLADYSGADMYDAGAHFKATSGWTGENGDDLLEFTALPGGKCNEEQTCSKIGTSGYWWTSTEKVKNSSHYALYLNGDGSSFTAENIMDNDQYISVRCVKK